MPISDDYMHTMMQRGWRGGLGDGTPCGRGSTIANTRNVARWLPEMCAKYSIETITDAGAGDLHWMKNVDWGGVEYQGYDLVPRHPDVLQLDITKQSLPSCDAILCRMVLNHLHSEHVDAALALFQQSARYLFATQFINPAGTLSRGFTRLDLCKRLGEPLDMIQDGHEDNCRLALWKI